MKLVELPYRTVTYISEPYEVYDIRNFDLGIVPDHKHTSGTARAAVSLTRT